LTPRYTIGRFPKEEGPERDTRITRSIESGSDLLKSGANHMPVGVLDVLSARVMERVSIAAAFCLLLAGQVIAACGDKGGPDYRSPSGRFMGWADIGKTCGNPPSARCTAENAAGGADLGQKAWDAGRDARKPAGRSD
jgi:hypothetical protein